MRALAHLDRKNAGPCPRCGGWACLCWGVAVTELGGIGRHSRGHNDAGETLRLAQHPHPLTGQKVWSLWRMSDGKLEATSFQTASAADAWAKRRGYKVVK